MKTILVLLIGLLGLAAGEASTNTNKVAMLTSTNAITAEPVWKGGVNTNGVITPKELGNYEGLTLSEAIRLDFSKPSPGLIEGLQPFMIFENARVVDGDQFSEDYFQLGFHIGKGKNPKNLGWFVRSRSPLENGVYGGEDRVGIALFISLP